MAYSSHQSPVGVDTSSHPSLRPSLMTSGQDHHHHSHHHHHQTNPSYSGGISSPHVQLARDLFQPVQSHQDDQNYIRDVALPTSSLPPFVSHGHETTSSSPMNHGQELTINVQDVAHTRFKESDISPSGHQYEQHPPQALPSRSRLYPVDYYHQQSPGLRMHHDIHSSNHVFQNCSKSSYDPRIPYHHQNRSKESSNEASLENIQAFMPPPPPPPSLPSHSPVGRQGLKEHCPTYPDQPSENQDDSLDLQSSPEPMTVSESKNHCLQAFDRLRFFREQGRFCDLILSIQGRQFPAHRCVLASCSPWFDSKLKVHKTVKEEIKIDCCQNLEIFYALLTYFYTGHIVIDRNNVTELLHLCDFFSVTKLKAHCCDYLLKTLHMKNAFRVINLAVKYNLSDLLKQSVKFLQKNFSSLINSTEMADLSFNAVKVILSREKSWAMIPQEDLLIFVANWVFAHIQGREELLMNLLSNYIDFNQMSLSFLCDHLDKHQLYHASIDALYTILHVIIDRNGIYLGSKYQGIFQSVQEKILPQEDLDDLNDSNSFLSMAINSAVKDLEQSEVDPVEWFLQNDPPAPPSQSNFQQQHPSTSMAFSSLLQSHQNSNVQPNQQDLYRDGASLMNTVPIPQASSSSLLSNSNRQDKINPSFDFEIVDQVINEQRLSDERNSKYRETSYVKRYDPKFRALTEVFRQETDEGEDVSSGMSHAKYGGGPSSSNDYENVLNKASLHQKGSFPKSSDSESRMTTRNPFEDSFPSSSASMNTSVVSKYAKYQTHLELRQTNRDVPINSDSLGTNQSGGCNNMNQYFSTETDPFDSISEVHHPQVRQEMEGMDVEDSQSHSPGRQISREESPRPQSAINRAASRNDPMKDQQDLEDRSLPSQSPKSHEDLEESKKDDSKGQNSSDKQSIDCGETEMRGSEELPVVPKFKSVLIKKDLKVRPVVPDVKENTPEKPEPMHLKQHIKKAKLLAEHRLASEDERPDEKYTEVIKKKGKPKVNLKCDKCNYTTHKRSRMKVHSKQHERNDQTRCVFCNYSTPWKKEMAPHVLRTHFPDGPPFACDVSGCSYKADKIYMIRNHKLTHSKSQDFKCSREGCIFQTRTERQLKQHLESHDPKFECPQCHKKFPLRKTLNTHMLTHSVSQPLFTCEKCSFTTKCKSYLVSHLKHHKGISFKCDFEGCKYTAPKLSRLENHRRTHLKEKNFVCKECSRAFVERSQLVRHQRIHSDEMPFACSHCQFRTKRRDKLKNHVMKIHKLALDAVDQAKVALTYIKKDASKKEETSS